MTQTPNERPALCDRCGAVLSPENGHRATLGNRELLLCKVHVREHRARLEKDGWTLEPIALPDPVAGPLYTATCSGCSKLAPARKVTALPGEPAVQVMRCSRCDTRRCTHPGPTGPCDRVVTNPKDPICAGGHTLMPEAVEPA